MLMDLVNEHSAIFALSGLWTALMIALAGMSAQRRKNRRLAAEAIERRKRARESMEDMATVTGEIEGHDLHGGLIDEIDDWTQRAIRAELDDPPVFLSDYLPIESEIEFSWQTAAPSFSPAVESVRDDGPGTSEQIAARCRITLDETERQLTAAAFIDHWPDPFVGKYLPEGDDECKWFWRPYVEELGLTHRPVEMDWEKLERVVLDIDPSVLDSDGSLLRWPDDEVLITGPMADRFVEWMAGR